MELFDRRTAPKRADTWFVYALVDSRSPEEIRYIGITNNPKARLSLHLSQAPKEGWKKSRWIGSVIDADGAVLMGIIATGLSQDDAMAMEVELIAEHRNNGVQLMNLTDGGDGVKGQVQSAETRAKKSAALTGKPKSPEAVAKQAEAVRGRKLSDEQRAKMSASHLKRYEDPAAREVQRQGTLKRFENPIEREKAAEATRKRFSDPEEREKASLASKKVMADEEVRMKISTAVRAAWTDPVLLQRQSEKMLLRFEDPNERARLSLAHRLKGPANGNYKGVSPAKLGRWRARITVEGKGRHLGTFDTECEAAKAYDIAAYAEWGDDCFLNFRAAKVA